MKYFSEEDFKLFQKEAEKLGLELSKRDENTVSSDWDEIDVFQVIVEPYDFSRLSMYNVYNSETPEFLDKAS